MTLLTNTNDAMNDKIKELAKKSGATFLQSTDGKVEYIDYNQTFFDIEQFANLIIQECYQICKDNAMSVEDQKDLTYNDGVFDCALMIKDHFGLLKDQIY